MTIAPSAAAAAYQTMSKIAGGASTPAQSVSPPAQPGGSFSDFLSGALKDAVNTVQTGEQMAVQQVAGKADMVDVVSAVNSAELTLDTVVAVRDKVVQAYQSIMNMPI